MPVSNKNKALNRSDRLRALTSKKQTWVKLEKKAQLLHSNICCCRPLLSLFNIKTNAITFIE